ncbi:hypothetical protein EPUS_01583 [Endocarpon pusillum Z07020]|uniref:Uncharacterized protein n=1 Tax=Endocarpon pusillum (strain Z07020 / HMAS-L-300199) TaxID=1263415 RepID=U1GTM0_ENDPU|nr:uncharacterized protein EPUS_01583 [Endocarpon pusillum Z07020]ERF75753.1 hypothetical protein EPUS_01583 [Endocarpon pusillum Z07020]
MAAHAGLIVLAVVVVAAGAAAYENPNVREWLEHSRRKIAHALHSLGDEINPRVKQSGRNDPSMQEDETQAAEERRRRARAEIMEKGRIMEERRRRKRGSQDLPSPTGSFDTLVDKDGMLKKAGMVDKDEADATTTAVEPIALTEGLTNRRPDSPAAKALHESVDAPISLRQLSTSPDTDSEDPFVTEYEREMRNAWNLPLPPQPAPTASSAHESESLIDFTPTSEFPDPEIIIPHGTTGNDHALEQTEYFSIASNSSHTLSEAQFSSPPVVLPYASQSHLQPASASASIADSIDHVQASDVEGSVSDDGVLSEFGDGIRTPASGWTDVGSVVSSDAGQ